MVDEAVQLLDSTSSPLSIQLEARVAGRIDEARLRSAVRSAVETHPMAQAQRVPSNRWSSRDRWAFPRRRSEILRVITCTDDDQLAAARAELQSLPSPLTVASPLRAWLARHPSGDVLMLNAHHAAMDGFGALTVMRSIARAYAGAPEAGPEIDFADTRHLPSQLLESDGSTRLHRSVALAERLGDLVRPPARIASEGSTARPGYGLQTRVLTVAETDAVVGADHPGTVNDLLLAAHHLTIAGWNAEHGLPSRRIAVMVPVNLRPASWRGKGVGNFALPARVSTTPRSRRSRRAVLAAITEQTSRQKRTGMGGDMLELLRHTGRLPLWAKSVSVKLIGLTGDRLVDTSMFSNLGRVDDPIDFGGDAGEATEIWFSPPARMPLGISIGVVTTGGRLHLVFRHLHTQCGTQSASQFADRYMEEVAHLCALLSPRRRHRRASGYGLELPPPVGRRSAA